MSKKLKEMEGRELDLDDTCTIINELVAEVKELRELADSFYNWTLVNYPEEYGEYHEDVKRFKELGNE